MLYSFRVKYVKHPSIATLTSIGDPMRRRSTFRCLECDSSTELCTSGRPPTTPQQQSFVTYCDLASQYGGPRTMPLPMPTLQSHSIVGDHYLYANRSVASSRAFQPPTYLACRFLTSRQALQAWVIPCDVPMAVASVTHFVNRRIVLIFVFPSAVSPHVTPSAPPLPRTSAVTTSTTARKASISSSTVPPPAVPARLTLLPT